MRRCVWSRNLKNEEAMARDGPQRHRGEKIKKIYELCLTFHTKTNSAAYFYDDHK